ncbi:hypothetical protein MPTK1_5g12460 [Marchantia polymorpha subsp. ruderalis]|uniref:Uncharacterized protein n=2 Tax=Marchantia polymorpha TaxID=3197 RepID=A0AAF6BHL7_MARPO|nr:hypothetical protein MARPO_0092s0060 [Marchantia polymorpha]BBN11501.1 hypothetical protein Mp_5g12460 [Marchantia polymorpha subsp. ruderalis]|eukprot:PTQ33099.1 hypothetical protein MARPO_0092s0060 [Marchantia polymorpha]
MEIAQIKNYALKVLILATFLGLFWLCIVFGAFAIDGDIVFTGRQITVGVFLIIFGAVGTLIVTCICCAGIENAQVICNVECCCC